MDRNKKKDDFKKGQHNGEFRENDEDQRRFRGRGSAKVQFPFQ